ncbi:hypothetical protein [Bradyrhizobium sp. OAE829]|uniref:hypothetical protein n=1 Tax=Bradyrhizobium sp. OAE829 TaxID=2663807 RepID=UPI00178985A5
MTDTTSEVEIHRTTTGKASTNAERQRRYRQRNATVTQRNALTITPPVTLSNGTVLCAAQDKIEISFDDDGDAIITQARWPDEDQMIVISRDNIGTFIDNLTDALGIGSIGGPR